jgi:hypothetical protein
MNTKTLTFQDYYEIAEIAHKAGNSRKALKKVDRALRLSHKNVDALVLRANILKKL